MTSLVIQVETSPSALCSLKMTMGTSISHSYPSGSVWQPSNTRMAMLKLDSRDGTYTMDSAVHVLQEDSRELRCAENSANAIESFMISRTSH